MNDASRLDASRIVDEAITSRRSVRAFLPTPVARTVIEDIVGVARNAPSGSNIQPWRVYVLTGAAKTSLTEKLLAAHDAVRDGADAQYQQEYQYYPRQWFEPYIGRRRELGWALYGLLGIGKGDFEKSHAQHGRNFSFFGAPVGMMFTLDRRLELGSWLDYGMFIQNIMVAARGRGLDTCPQQAFCRYHSIVIPHIGAGAHEQLICGMSLGYVDRSAPANQLQPGRAAVAEFTNFIGD